MARGRLRRKPLSLLEQLRGNVASLIVILISLVAVVALALALLFGIRLAALAYLGIAVARWPICGLIVLGAFVDRSKFWLMAAAFAYLLCLLLPPFLGVLARL